MTLFTLSTNKFRFCLNSYVPIYCETSSNTFRGQGQYLTPSPTLCSRHLKSRLRRQCHTAIPEFRQWEIDRANHPQVPVYIFADNIHYKKFLVGCFGRASLRTACCIRIIPRAARAVFYSLYTVKLCTAVSAPPFGVRLIKLWYCSRPDMDREITRYGPKACERCQRARLNKHITRPPSHEATLRSLHST